MKAVYFEKFGGPDVLIYGDKPDPVARPGQVVIDIHAASVNAADNGVRADGGRHKPSLPHIPGRDFSGVVSALGAGVDDLKIGDEVFAVALQTNEGGYAEKVAIDAAIAGKKPASLSHVETAAIALTGLTALCAIEDRLALKRGETILIQGGAGGVASFAIQVAKHIGATIITTASAGNHDYVKGLGADRVIDYNREDFTRLGPVCDAVFDTVGGEVQVRSWEVVKPGGRMTWVANAPEDFKPTRTDITAGRPDVTRDRAHLDRISALVAAGVVKPPAITRFKLSQAAEAHRISESRHLRGKLVFEVR